MTTDNEEWINNNLDEAPEETDADFEGNIFLSTDGKMTVSGKATTKEGRKAMLMWAKNVHDRLMLSYGSKQRTSVKEYKKAAEETGGPKCEFCGEPAIEKTGVAKNGRKWHALFCSSDNKAHTKWLD